MPAPAWFHEEFSKFVVELQRRAASGTALSPEQVTTDFWTRITGHSERQVANALAEVFGTREVPVMLQGEMVHRVHVERIAKYLVNRGLVMDEEPLLPGLPMEARHEGVSRVVVEDRWPSGPARRGR